jgi:uncharacterized RDD family membrane protein YckC
MKCPKCQYISFDSGPRCRNCGYEFSLAEDAAELDLPIRTGDEPVGPFSDFSLEEAAPAAPDAGGQLTEDYQGNLGELPLFGTGARDPDAPLVSLPVAPRAPVAVRKSTLNRPAPQRPAFEEPELDLEPPSPPPSRVAQVPALPRPLPPDQSQPAAAAESASAGARLFAAIIDVSLLGSIDAAVLYFTLRLCGLTFADAREIPLVPFAAFIGLLNGGYMSAFTAAGGQSLGKMVAGIKVITMDQSSRSDRVPLGQAVLRAAGYLVSALPAGLGFLPALVGPEHRAVHDRLAHTRVVRA